MAKPKIFAFTGSIKKNSSNAHLLKHIQKEFKEEVNLLIYEGLGNLPHFNPDFTSKNIPEVVLDFRMQITEADVVLICTPEYVFSMPAILKNALEWCVSEVVFTDKPVAIIVASAGGQRAMEQITMVLETIQSKLSPKTQLLISGIKGKFDANGGLIDEAVKKNVEDLMKALQRNIS